MVFLPHYTYSKNISMCISIGRYKISSPYYTRMQCEITQLHFSLPFLQYIQVQDKQRTYQYPILKAHR